MRHSRKVTFSCWPNAGRQASMQTNTNEFASWRLEVHMPSVYSRPEARMNAQERIYSTWNGVRVSPYAVVVAENYVFVCVCKYMLKVLVLSWSIFLLVYVNDLHTNSHAADTSAPHPPNKDTHRHTHTRSLAWARIVSSGPFVFIMRNARSVCALLCAQSEPHWHTHTWASTQAHTYSQTHRHTHTPSEKHNPRYFIRIGIRYYTHAHISLSLCERIHTIIYDINVCIYSTYPRTHYFILYIQGATVFGFLHIVLFVTVKRFIC